MGNIDPNYILRKRWKYLKKQLKKQFLKKRN